MDLIILIVGLVLVGVLVHLVITYAATKGWLDPYWAQVLRAFALLVLVLYLFMRLRASELLPNVLR